MPRAKREKKKTLPLRLLRVAVQGLPGAARGVEAGRGGVGEWGLKIGASGGLR